MKRLSTGARIDSANDDPAGIFILSGIGSTLSGMKVAANNTALAMDFLNISIIGWGSTRNIDKFAKCIDIRYAKAIIHRNAAQSAGKCCQLSTNQDWKSVGCKVNNWWSWLCKRNFKLNKITNLAANFSPSFALWKQRPRPNHPRARKKAVIEALTKFIDLRNEQTIGQLVCYILCRHHR